jgi:hypothetical protein
MALELYQSPSPCLPQPPYYKFLEDSHPSFFVFVWPTLWQYLAFQKYLNDSQEFNSLANYQQSDSDLGLG